MDPTMKADNKVVTLGDLISYYYEKFSEIYDDNEELRDLAVTTQINDLLTRASDK